MPSTNDTTASTSPVTATVGTDFTDQTDLERVPFVMKGGAVIKDELSATSAAPAARSPSR